MLQTARGIVENNCTAGAEKLPETEVNGVIILGFRTSEGRITRIRVNQSKETIFIYSSQEALKPHGKGDVHRLILFLAEVNELIPFGNLVFDFDKEEVFYKTGQSFFMIENKRETLTYLLEQHEKYHPTVVTGLQSLFTNVQEEPEAIARRTFHT